MTNWRTTLWGCFFAVATVIAANPHSIDFLGDPKTIQTVAGIAALVTGAATFVNTKDRQISGNGTIDAPSKIAQSDGTSKVIAPLIAAVLIPVLALTGCGTPLGMTTANFLESPMNRALVQFAVASGENYLASRLGGSVPPEARDAITQAAGAAATSLSDAAISSLAQALRTQQSTAQAANPSALAAAGTSQSTAPAPVAAAVGAQVTTLAHQGIAADTANEAVARTLDAVVTARAK